MENDLIRTVPMLVTLSLVQMENIVGVIEGLRGSTTDTIYDVFFTEKRVVAAIVLHFSDFADMHWKPDLTSIFFGNMFEQRQIKLRSLKLMDERRLAFKDKTLDEILSLHKANVEIDYEEIASVEVKKGLLTTNLEFTVKGHQRKKIDFRLEKIQIDEVEKLIERLLPNKAK